MVNLGLAKRTRAQARAENKKRLQNAFFYLILQHLAKKENIFQNPFSYSSYKAISYAYLLAFGPL